MDIAKILLGKKVLSFSIAEHCFCKLELGGDGSLSAEALLRFVGNDGMFVASKDHKHEFGHSSAYDAEEAICRMISGEVIQGVQFKQDTGDLVLNFGNGRLEIICSSGGYEAFQISFPGEPLVVVTGGPQ